MEIPPRRCPLCVLAGGLLLAIPALAGAFTLGLSTSLPSPQPVGTTVEVTATAAGASGPLVVRFEVRDDPGPWRIARDFDSRTDFAWTSIVQGPHSIRAVALDPASGETQQAGVAFQLESLAGGGDPVVVATDHPLVALFDAPPCPAPGLLRVLFRPLPASIWTATPFMPCGPTGSSSTYIAGLQPQTDYLLLPQFVVAGGPAVLGRPLAFRSGVPDPVSADYGVQVVAPGTSVLDPVLLRGYVASSRDPRTPIATDLAGNLLWYYVERDPAATQAASLLRPVPGGTFLTTNRRADLKGQYLREVDLLGHIIGETNVDEINRQLARLGQDPIGSFHHEALRLPSGHTLVLASVERLVDELQGPGTRDVVGDMVLDLDPDLRVAWVWNSFEHLDLTERAVLGETCTHQAPGCPPLFLGSEAEDWTHSNSIGYSPGDGNLVISVRHHDAVYKIDYAGGSGDGAVLWRLGKGGDFTWVSSAAWPWFSHQHDVRYDGPFLLVYDNGNTRKDALGPDEHSRGQVLLLDEREMVVGLVHSFDLGAYSRAVGSAQRLSNGNFHFNNGFLSGPSHAALEFGPDGVPRWVSVGGGRVYRSFRMRSLYE